MTDSQKTSFRFRIRPIFQQTGQKSGAKKAAESSDQQVDSQMSGDRRRTIGRYVEAGTFLLEAIKGRASRWESFDFPELPGEPEKFNDVEFLSKINDILLDRQRRSDATKTVWEKCRHAIECSFAVASPIATFLSSVAHSGASVCCLLCPK